MDTPGRVRLGFAVKVLGAGGLPSHDTRRWQSGPSLAVSLERLDAILAYLDAKDIRLYRMATALAPYASHPGLPQFRDAPARNAVPLARVGERARALGIRLTTHPGQYTVLNSTDPEVQRLAAVELEVQAEIMDGMGLGPEAVVVLHVGGATGGVEAGLDRFARGFELLSDGARARLVIENDDRTYALADVLRLAERIGRPVVWDVLHHHCHDPHGIPDREALGLALDTWPEGVRPKVHFSSPRTALKDQRALPPLRAHADLVDPISFEWFLATVAAGMEVDVMLEAKGKDLALLRLRDQLAARAGAQASAATPSRAPSPRAKKSQASTTSPAGSRK